MGGFGFGHGSGQLRPQVTGGLLSGSTPPLLEPSAQWTGTAASGFSAPPVDPTRTTAKPACRLLVPPHQYFNGTLDVGVIAFANDGGTLIGGIDRVRFHFEGRSVDVVQPTWRAIATATGVRRYYGYWVRLKKPASISGHAQLYVEAIPADATMQNRVIGPFQFSPQATLYDAELTVTPSQPEVAGENYHTVGAAMEYHRSAALDNTLITVTEALTEDLTSTAAPGAYYVGEGYCTIQADAPVTFARPTQGFAVASQIRNRINRMCFRGCNITFDMKNISALWTETGTGQEGQHWLDGCRMINSDGRGGLWLAGSRPYRLLVDGRPFFTEVEFAGVADCAVKASLARGCEATATYQDFTSDSGCIIGNVLDDFDSMQEWLVDVPALNVAYNGAEATATIALAGSNNAATRTMTAVWGSNSATFTISRSEANYTAATDPAYNAATAGVGYFVQDVANWLNSLTGWSATLIDNTRRGSFLGRATGRGAGFSAQNVKNTTLQLVTCLDAHADFYQRHPGTSENVIIAFNRGTNMRGQNIFFASASGSCDDFIVVGNAFSNIPSTSGPYGIFTQTSSQFAGTPHRHVVFAHNTMPTQRLILRSDDAGYSNDAYCLIANNALMNLLYQTTPQTQHLNVETKYNVIDSGFAAPAGSTGTVIDGDYASKHVNALAGDFTPAGVLAALMFTPVAELAEATEAQSTNRPAGAL